MLPLLSPFQQNHQQLSRAMCSEFAFEALGFLFTSVFAGTKRRGLSSSHSDLGWRRGEDTLMLRPVTIECTGA
ncbi:hypothetical protein Celaphus_00019167 [Cervus elaphus hippelaphus]|uniref:Uncharacterized protein n=1 Tax=Cervus elaphus hippelaphus TaxID=46360 RepID=A0A212C7F1_CEREH|nr:hypothetical protein Celaphus_00019167 [Cervus elaphus hippelaphus]